MTSPATAKLAAVSSRQSHPHLARAGAAARWTLAVLAGLWLALCTAVGPLYWDEENGTLAHWNWANTAIFVVSFLIYLGIITLMVRFAAGQRILPRAIGERLRQHQRNSETSRPAADQQASQPAKTRRTVRAIVTSTVTVLDRWITRGTNRFWKLMLVFFVGWLWVPTTLLAAFGADLRSQIREFSWAWNQWTGLKQPYIGFFSFVPMDIYPTAHYMWPSDPTYLTDQHNVVLTVFYGAMVTFARHLTGSNDAGIVTLAALQTLFAVFCCAAAANRFLNRPWIGKTATDSAAPPQAGGLARFLILLFFMVCPLAVFSTISITKSPLFAFSFVWWFSVWYELVQTWHPAGTRKHPQTPAIATPVHLPRHSFIAFILATSVMLISAKYAWYIIALQIVLALIADRKRWAT